jgi:hypothetical protein
MKHYKHHFIIVFDDEINKWVHATDVEEEVFTSGTAYDIETGLWEHGYQGGEVFLPNEEEACAKVSLMIKQLNKVSA